MATMEYKREPSSARKSKVLEFMNIAFEGDLSPWCHDDVMKVRDGAIAALSEFYGARAVRTTFNAICREKGWEIKPQREPKPDKNGLGQRMDQIDTRISSSEGALIELAKRVTALADLVNEGDNSLQGRIIALGSIAKGD